MSKILLIALFCINLFSAAVIWDTQEEISLKKDEIYEKIITDGVREKKLYFRWTLFMNEGLVMHLNYDGFNKQFILYKQYGLDSFKLNLLPQQNYEKEGSFIFLVFKDMDIMKKIATFELYIKK